MRSLTDYGVTCVYIVLEDEPLNDEFPTVIKGAYATREGAQDFINGRPQREGIRYEIEEWPILP